MDFAIRIRQNEALGSRIVATEKANLIQTIVGNDGPFRC
jgi:hypothetical protein